MCDKCEGEPIIFAWVECVQAGGAVEVFFVTIPTIEGQGTALHIMSVPSGFPVQLTNLTRVSSSDSLVE